ncbi:MAG: hypothetical protein ACJ76L_15350 [Conexibacter sp.]
MAATILIAASDDGFVYDNGPIGDPAGAPLSIGDRLDNAYDMVAGVIVDNRAALFYLGKLALIFAFGYALFSMYRRRGGGA